MHGLIRLLIGLFIVFLPLHFAHGDWSIWEKSKQEAYQVEGIIKSISINEDQHEILVKVAPLKDPQASETIKVCTLETGSDIRNFEQSEKMATLRQALGKGDKIKLSYNSPFDRCLSKVDYESSANKKQVAQ